MLLTMLALPSGEVITTLPTADSGSDSYITPIAAAPLRDIARLCGLFFFALFRIGIITLF